MKAKTKQSAFTLIELLVVIAIIGILATLAVVALQQARQNARDAKRVADVKQMSTALELFFNDNQSYPDALEELQTGGYMQILPSAPSVADGTCTPEENNYEYTVGTENSTYTLSFCSGKQVSDLSPGPLCMTPGGLTTNCSGGAEATSGTFVDARDGQEYAWVKIGDQTWMAENLNVGNMINGVNDQINNSTIEKYCYENLESNCDIYGGLYQWNEMMQYVTTEDAQGICPEGWHIPSDAQWHALENSLATGTCDPSRMDVGCDPAGSKLAGSYGLWNNGILRNHIDFDDSDFNILPAGSRNPNGSFGNFGSFSFLWSSSFDGSSAWYRRLGSSRSSVFRYGDNLALGFSVRCLRTE